MSGKEPDVVTAAEAIKLLRVSRSTLYAMVKRGTLKPIPVSSGLLRPRTYTFHRADVEKLMPPAEA